MCANKKCKQVSEFFMDDKAAAGCTESTVTSFCNNYAEELVLMLDEDHEILKDSPEDPPAPSSAGELGTSAFPLC